MGNYSAIGPHAVCYNPDKIFLGSKVTISQRAYLCTASHDISHPHIPLITEPVRIESFAWVAADAFVGMGVNVGEGAVIGARAAVFKDVEPWTVVGGNPARIIKKRIVNE
jgi:putative colanic acid biosynthesis acetyltransferase WcaF